MQDISNNLSYSDATAKLREYQDYKDILEEFGLSYTEKNHYWQVGEMDAVQGWILHLSCVRTQIADLFRTVIPELLNDDIPFRIVKDNELAKMIMYANLGVEMMGKMMAIYPKQHTDIVLLAHKLIVLTKDFRGPAILTDRRLGGIVYTRYGSYNGIRNKENPADLNRYIYSPSGELVVDEYKIPFALPAHLSWPFDAIADPAATGYPKIWNKVYKPLLIVRQNVKGMVVKCVYMKSFFNPKYCIIKEGKMGMWEDEWGRDIQDRLEWQYEICNDLIKDIPFPKIFDLFRMGDDMYLAMEFIRGKSLEDIVIETYNGLSWSELKKEHKLKLCDYLIKIIAIIKKLHEKGYVHRDINGNNFLINKKGEIKLIDVELAYSIKKNKPEPAFKYGSEGFISPQQDQHEIPTVEEDIYALGGLISLVLTGLHPNKYNKLVSGYSKEQFLALNNDIGIAEIVEKATSADPASRPDINTMLEELNRYHANIKMGSVSPAIQINKIEDDKITKVIQAGINALGTGKYAEPDIKWHSPIAINDNNGIGVPQFERTYIASIYNGMTGTIYLTTMAAALSYDISGLVKPYEGSVAHLIKKYLADKKELAPGLYEGWAGMALAFLEGMRAGILQPDETNGGMVAHAFESVSEAMDLASGVAGQGVALLQCMELLDGEGIKTLLDFYVKTLLDSQQSDGAWFGAPGSPYEKIKHPALAVGAGGIVIFLIAYNQRFNDARVDVAIKKALSWMISQAKKVKDSYHWKLSGKHSLTDRYSRDFGVPGIALTFIYAYTQLKDPLYKEVAVGSLLGLNAQPCLMDFSVTTGLAGLGDVYLEAKNAFGDEIWQERADWIANLLISAQVQHLDGSLFWIVGFNPDSPAELMTGFSGILYFLLKYQHPDMFNNLLLP